MHSAEYAFKCMLNVMAENVYFVSQIISLDKNGKSFFVQFCCFICYDLR